jgi:hypothetical protein
LLLFRKIVLLGAAVALPMAMLIPSSGASAPKVDVSDDMITCNTVIATTTVSPALSNGGSSSTPTKITVKGSVNGCTVTGPNPATVLSGTFTAKLAGTGNTCTGLLGTTPTTGDLTFKWKGDPTTPLLQTSSIVTVTGITGGTHSESLNGGSQTYGDFIVDSSGVTGAFTGPDHGTTSSNESVTSQDVGALLGGCGTTNGLKTINIGLGTFTLA